MSLGLCEEVGTVSSLARCGRVGGGGLGILNGLDDDLAVKRGSSQKAGMPGMPAGLECPVGDNWKFANDLSSMGIPANAAIVLATRQKQIAVLTTPGKGQDALVMPFEDSLWCARISQVPHQNQGILICGDRGRELGGYVWIPSHGTDGFATVVVQGQVLLLGLDVPDSHKASATAGDENVRDLLVPVQTIKIIGPCGAGANAKWLGRFAQVCDVKFALVTSGSKKLRSVRVELEGLYGSCVL